MSIKQWSDHMQGMLVANRPGSLGHAVLEVLATYEAARTGSAQTDVEIREGFAKGFELWRVEEARKLALEQARAKASGDDRNRSAREQQMEYRNQVRDQAADFLSRAVIGSGGHATILLISIYDDYKTGDELHDQTLAAGLGLAFDAWAKREQEIANAMQKPKAQA